MNMCMPLMLYAAGLHSDTIPGWVLLLFGIVFAGAGVIVALLLLKRKK